MEKAGIELRVCRSRGGRLDHWANEVVLVREVRVQHQSELCSYTWTDVGPWTSRTNIASLAQWLRRFSVIFRGFFFHVIFGPVRSPPVRFPFSVCFFLLFHLSLSELSVSFCVHFSVRRHAHVDFQLFSQKFSDF